MAHVIKGNNSRKFFDKVWPLGPRADQAHFPPKHVEQLWQLVYPGVADEPSDPGGARIGYLRPKRPSTGFSIPMHAAKLEERKILTKQTHSLLSVQDGPCTIQFDHNCHEDH